LESLQDFRPSRDLVDALARVSDEDELDPPDGNAETGVVPLSWLLTRWVGELACEEPVVCVDVTHSSSISELCNILLCTLDAGDLLSNDFEHVCPRVSNALWRRHEGFHGIMWPCKLAGEHDNYALFETGYSTDILRARLTIASSARVSLDDPALSEAMDLLHLSIHPLDFAVLSELRGESWDEGLHRKVSTRPELAILTVEKEPMRLAKVSGAAAGVAELTSWVSSNNTIAFVFRDGSNAVLFGRHERHDGSIETYGPNIISLRDLERVAERVAEILAGNVAWNQ
jgi:hypothetical protein